MRNRSILLSNSIGAGSARGALRNGVLASESSMLAFRLVSRSCELRTILSSDAFDHLDAQAALTEVFQDNHASQGVSRKFGYEPDGISRDRRGDEAVVSDRLRLTRQKWLAGDRTAVTVAGAEHCQSMFGM